MEIDLAVTAEMTPDQARAFEELKRSVIVEHGERTDQDDYYLRRFLRAREYDVEKAATMIRNNIAWRKKFDIDNLKQADDIPEVLLKYIPMNTISLDKQDQLTLLFHFGNTDIKGISVSSKKSDFIRYLTKCTEEHVEILKQKSKEQGRVIEKWNYILDFEDMTLAQATHKEGVEIFLHFLSIYEANYPERLNVVYIINASVYFTILLRLAKPLLSGETLRKLVILGKDDYRRELGKFVSLENLPAYLGGYKTDPDGNPKCSTIVNHGGVVPRSYYLSKTERTIANEKDCKKYNVPRRSTITLQFEVEVPGSQIEWQFEMLNRDIGFGISRISPITNKAEELVPIQRVETKFTYDCGVFTCYDRGTYIFVFDNTFSWWRPKELYCRAYLVSPDGQRTCVTS